MLVGGLDITAVLGGEVLIENMGIVKIPRPAAQGDDEEERGGWDEGRGALRSEAEARAPSIVGAAAGGCDGNGCQ
jgi:hypothetical protein